MRAIVDEKGLSYTPQAGENTYVVQKGDSLYSIARKYNTTVSELVSLNNLSNTTLKVGQILLLPSESEIIEDVSIGQYVVKPGDSLYLIAQNYDITVDELKKLNNLTSNSISIGQILNIPTEENTPIDVDYYTVVAGDSLYSIARKFNTTVSELLALNNLDSNVLQIGQLLKISKEDVSNNDNATQSNIYTVVLGDSLYSIAQKYGTTVNELKNENNLTSDILSIGQKLVVPSTNKSVNYYTVKSGDTLYSVAKKFNTTVSKIKEVNNLSSNLISLNQELIIPTS